MNVGLDGGLVITLSTPEAVQHSPEILKLNAIARDRRVGMLCVQRMLV